MAESIWSAPSVPVSRLAGLSGMEYRGAHFQASQGLTPASLFLATPATMRATTAPLVVYFHGRSENQDTGINADRFAGVRDTLLAAGYAIATSAGGGLYSWANTTALDAYQAAYQHAAGIITPSRVFAIGWSMGGVESLASIAQGRIPTPAAWAGMSPSANLAGQYADSTQHAADMETAYTPWATPGTWDDTATAGHDPLNDYPASTWASTAFRFYASPADPVVSKATNTDQMHAKLSGAGVTSSVVTCSGGHTDASMFQPSDVLAYFDAYR